MASRIATQLDAYNIGGTKPTGYIASKCCTNAMAMSCGCANPGYTSKRLVPENLLKPDATYWTLTLTVWSNNWQYYSATVSVSDESSLLLNDVLLGNVPDGTLTLDQRIGIKENSRILVSFKLAWYGNSRNLMSNGLMHLDGDLYPNIVMTDNDIAVDIEFDMTGSRQIIAYVDGE